MNQTNTKHKGIPPGYVRKLFLVMRLTTVLLFLSLMQLSAKSVAQLITLKERNASLENVLQKVRRQGGFDIFFDREILNGKRPINVNVKNVSTEEAIKAILKGLSLTYTIDEKSIVIKENSMLDDLRNRITAVFKPAITINGRVLTKKAEPLPGAQVTVKRTSLGVTTDEKGTFALKNVEESDSIIVSYIGYQSKTVAVNSKSLTIFLEETTNDLDEVKVIGYGTTTQRLTTGNITSIKADEIARQPVMNPLLALEGRVPGLEINATGYAAGPVRMEIRGRQSVNSNFSSDPLIIIDGVPFTVLDLSPGLSGRGLDLTRLSASEGQSPLFNINPSDIESIDILKDADATAIYGSRGANGVILITTKKGKSGAATVDLNVSQGASIVSGRWDMLNTEQYLAMRREAFANDNKIPTPATAGELFYNLDKETDWQDYVWGNSGQWTNLQAGLSGGNQNTTFRLAGGYSTTKDITVASGDNTRVSIGLNLQNKSTNQRFTTTMSLNYSFAKINQIFQTANVKQAPNAPDPYDANGAPNIAEYRLFSASFPFSNLFQPYENTTKMLTGNLGLAYSIHKGLIAKINFGYSNSLTNNSLTQPSSSKYTAAGAVAEKGNAFFGINQVNNWIAEPQLSYNAQLGKGRLTLLLGGTYQENTTIGNRTSGTGYTNDAFLGSISLAPIKDAIDNSGSYKYAGIFARASYNLENKYIINLNGRRDGSSRFGPGKQFGNFGSAGLAWIASEERFIKEFLPKAISFLKFRGSYGLTGSDAIGDYGFISLYSNSTSDYNGIPPLSPQQIANGDYHWEVNKKFEVAANLSLLNDKINLEAAYYSNRSNNQLISLPIPSYTGFSTVIANSPADVRNSGWEFTVNARLVAKKDFNYGVTFTFGMNKNKLLAFPDLASSPYADNYIIGEPLSLTYLYNFTGVDPLTGQYTYEDYSGDGKISSSESAAHGTNGDDKYVRVNLAPKFSGGFGHQFSYKNWSLNAFFTFKKQIGRNAFGSPSTNANMSLEQYLNRWQKPGDIAKYARLTTTSTIPDINYSVSTAGYSDASFIRLQNVALSWSMPKKWASKVGMNNLNVNVNAQNIFVITNYKGMDPQVQNFGSMPLKRTFTAGLSSSF
jgi:TonB-linked SusC/RagA family outer membrane protein